MPAPISPHPSTPTVLICMYDPSFIACTPRHADLTLSLGLERRLSASRSSVSTIAAIPCPPPMQADATPRLRPRRRSSSSSVSSRRVPLAPSGWPSAIAPPFTLTLSRSSPSSFSHARYCAANASLISIEIDVGQREPRLLEHLADRGHRPHAHQRRLDADRRPRHQPAERLQPVAADGVAPTRGRAPRRRRRCRSRCRP